MHLSLKDPFSITRYHLVLWSSQSLPIRTRDRLVLPKALGLKSPTFVYSTITCAVGTPPEAFIFNYGYHHFILTVALYFTIFVFYKSLYLFFMWLTICYIFFRKIIAILFLHAFELYQKDSLSPLSHPHHQRTLQRPSGKSTISSCRIEPLSLDSF